VKERSVAGEQSKRINVVLDEEHAAKLQDMAARMYVQPGTIARSLLSTAIDQVDPDAATITAILDAIPGAWDRTQEGLADARAGRVVPLDQL
jgi:predicted transcriptional regulator